MDERNDAKAQASVRLPVHCQACVCVASPTLRVSQRDTKRERQRETQHAQRCNLNTPPEAQEHAAAVMQPACTPEGLRSPAWRREAIHSTSQKKRLRRLEERLRHRLARGPRVRRRLRRRLRRFMT